MTENFCVMELLDKRSGLVRGFIGRNALHTSYTQVTKICFAIGNLAATHMKWRKF